MVSARAVGRNVLISLVVALLALLLALYLHRYFTNLWAYGIRAVLRDFLTQLKIGALGLGAFAALVTAFLLLQLSLSRWRRIRIFVSYQHTHLPLAEAAVAALLRLGLEPTYVPYRTTAEHDGVIAEARDKLRRSDAMIVFPGLDKSFVDAEVLSATSLCKVVMLVKIGDADTLPDTALRGYPVFELRALQCTDFRPIKGYLDFVCNSWRGTLETFVRAAQEFLAQFFTFCGLYIVVGRIVQDAANALIFMGRADLAGTAGGLWYVGLAAVSVVILTYTYLGAVTGRLRSSRIARQSIVTGHFTYRELSKALGRRRADQDILAAMQKEALAARHSAPGATGARTT